MKMIGISGRLASCRDLWANNG